MIQKLNTKIDMQYFFLTDFKQNLKSEINVIEIMIMVDNYRSWKIS